MKSIFLKINMTCIQHHQQPNPFLLPNIVSNIFQHINDAPTLEKLRTVCRCWNEEACISLRKLRTIEFTTAKSLQSYNAVFQHETFGVFPHSRYTFALRNEQKPASALLTTINNAQQSISQQQLINEFLDYFGKFITCFQLPVRSVHFEVCFLDAVIKKLPNIATLGLHIQYYHQQTLPAQLSPSTIQHLQRVHTLTVQIEGFEISQEKSSELLSLLFLYLPNLQRISCPGDIRRISKTGLFVRDVLLESDTSDNLTKLCELNFKTRLLEEQCLKLLCKEFPMKALYVDLYNPDDNDGADCVVDSSILAGLFQKWRMTLHHLEVEFPFRKQVSFHFNFPVIMENLTNLYLGGFEGCLLDLLRKIPQLCKLELGQLELMSVLPKPDEQDVYSNVKQLRLDFCMGQTAGILSRFARMFPQLQILNINHATNEVARVIFKKMSNLSTLTIQGNDLTDAGMCGFSEYATEENNLLSLSQHEGNKLRKYSYIADLKELQYLNIDAYALTEVTVRHGLVHCHSLRLVKMDSTAGAGGSSTIVSRKFRLSEYENFMVEEGRNGPMVEIKEEPPMENETLDFFQSHDKYSTDNLANDL